MGHNIGKAGERSRLEPRREPYWKRIEAGCFLGYRKLVDGTGTWIARWRNEEGAQKYHAIGSTPSVGYDAAVKAARQWFAQCKGGSTEVITVEEACRRYVIDRRAEKGEGTAKDAEGRFNRLVYGTKFGKIKLPSLLTSHISYWRNAQVAQDDDDGDDPDAERRAKDSTNRNLATLKAALNLAYRMGLAASTEQWARVQSYQQVAKRREVSLSTLDRKKLITAATPDLKVFLSAMLLTGCRPGELAGCAVGDLEASGLLTVAGKTGRRTIPVSPKALTLLMSSAGDRDLDEPLLTRSGVAWTRFEWRDAFQEARRAAQLPETVVMYSLRHVAISEMLVAGIDPMTVSKIAGTSVQMISSNYGHLIKERVVEQLAKVRAI